MDSTPAGIPRNVEDALQPGIELELAVGHTASATNSELGIELATQREQKEPTASEGSGTPLGSLARAKASLGNSNKTIDPDELINKEWGIQGTMFKIMRLVVNKVPRITVGSLLRRGPILKPHQRYIAQRCFISILRLQQHGFIKVILDSTYKIVHIELGPRITGNRRV